MQKRIVESDHLEEVCNQKRPRSQSETSQIPPDDEVDTFISTCSNPCWQVHLEQVETDDENNNAKIPKIGIDRDEEPWSTCVGSIYVDARRYGHKIHDQRAEQVTRVSNALRSINYNPNRKLSGNDLQQLVDTTKNRISLLVVHGQLALVFQRENNTEISRIFLRHDYDTDGDDEEHYRDMIYVYGKVNGNTTIVQIFMTQYWNVIAFGTPLTDRNIQCYVNNLEDLSNFLIKLYDKKPIVLDDTDTE